MILTNNGVAFPVADADFSVNNRRAFFNTDPVDFNLYSIRDDAFLRVQIIYYF